MPLTDLEWQAIAAQLRCPSGLTGAEVAQHMQRNNQPMLDRALASLALARHDRLLEIGPGNGAHLAQVLNLAPDLHYQGLDISPDMVANARQINAGWLAQGRADFALGDGHTLPFGDGQFTKMLTINTVYFWEDAPRYLAEIARVLAPGGRLVLAFASPAFLASQPFARFGFASYAPATLAQWLRQTGLRPAPPQTFTDQLTQPPQTREFIVLAADRA
ncbi:MAG: class I SAM-dependent methyltransferase [Bernardetiaceae bacterium]|jgi:ubiquinone/menaquinone biosynthesis C-methylase UbiE|nr:class I SAM-dependent methyltransferase [Bernardetiaceae bacterium]